MSVASVSVCIPTYRREQVLLDSLHALLACEPRAAEIIVVDQTQRHQPATERALETLDREGRIRWLRREQPSIPMAMNAGLRAATQPCVLFLDDDIVPQPQLVGAHRDACDAHSGALIAGRVLQPWDDDESAISTPTEPFRFAGTQAQWIGEFMGGNFSVPREAALQAGGFDENFVQVAYRFEAEFAHRWLASGRKIRFEPAACIHHLKAVEGGTRTFGEHLTTWRPDHAVGAYYWALRTRCWREFVRRPLRSVATRFHLRRPWRIPPTLWAEFSGMLWALRLNRSGPRHVNSRDRA